MNEVLPYGIVILLAAMTATTMLSRYCGFWMMGRVTLTPRIRRMLEALPGSVVAALIAPVTVKEGLPAIIAMVVVAVLMIWRRNEFLALACGLAVAAGIRALGY